MTKEAQIYKSALEDISPKVELPEDLKKLLAIRGKALLVLDSDFMITFSSNEGEKFEVSDTSDFPGIEYKSENVVVFHANNPAVIYAGNIFYTYHLDTELWTRSVLLRNITDKDEDTPRLIHFSNIKSLIS